MAGLDTLSRLKWTRVLLDAVVRALLAVASGPTQHGRRAFAAAAISLLALSAAGCGSSGMGSPSEPPAPPAPPPPPPDRPPPPPPPPPPPGTRAYESSPSTSTGPSTPQARLPAFPWPPPQPSSQIQVRRDRFAADSNLGGVATRLDAALRRCGHLRESYYAAPGGFAMVTRIERLREDARPQSEDRFVTPGPGTEGTYDFLGFVQSLWFAPTGYYRQIVFIVTDKPFVASEAPPTVEVANQMLAGGLGYLPENYARQAFTGRHRVEALIYEFQKQGDSRAEVALPARWNAHTHLLRLGLLHAL